MNPNGIFYRTGSIRGRVVIPYAGLDVLERKHAMKVLMSVRENGCMNKTELVESISVGASSVSTRIDELSEAGLFHVEEEEVPPFRKMVSLTDTGEQVAELISSIHGKLSD
ncbi:MAG: winged helix-turn-helix transcriptional regulator [Candidatus Methanomethylophilaceae archaeon]|nr:winged helix-turn-helix transcriptional regulator [Candidatus Methanomethylophilaceae archaeon]